MTLAQFMQSFPADWDPDPRQTFDAFIRSLTTDPCVLGAVLSGSQAREGMATGRSDYDVFVIVDDQSPDELVEYRGFRSPQLDLQVMRLEEFHSYALPEHEASWDAYAFVAAKVVFDRTGGMIGDVVARKGVLSAQDAHQRVAGQLDAYTNSVYRSLKNHRDGRMTAACLDASESIPVLLTVLFALHRRIRPYNKYLCWELEHRPLPGKRWTMARLLGDLERLRTDADPHVQRSLFIDIEHAAREQGHDSILDAWGDDLRFLRAG
jgi:predicted nucleotidyltransferase